MNIIYQRLKELKEVGEIEQQLLWAGWSGEDAGYLLEKLELELPFSIAINCCESVIGEARKETTKLVVIENGTIKTTEEEVLVTPAGDIWIEMKKIGGLK